MYRRDDGREGKHLVPTPAELLADGLADAARAPGHDAAQRPAHLGASPRPKGDEGGRVSVINSHAGKNAPPEDRRRRILPR